MMGILVVVESPNKVEKLQSLMGNKFKVVATVGHVCDLPTDQMGVNMNDFKPSYVITEQGRHALEKIVELLKVHDRILFATDPDREGEAIAYFVAKIIGIPVEEIYRLDIRELNQEGVDTALKNIRKLDRDLVKAQEARRVLDRLIGFSFSQKLSKVSGTKMAAGRVQSAVLKMICDLEHTIKTFESKTHYKVIFNMGDWQVRWNSKEQRTDDPDYMLCPETANLAKNVKWLKVDSVSSEDQTISPPPPFTTAKLIKVAAMLLDLAPDDVMTATQKLFVSGFITYHRTDSTRLSSVAIEQIRSYLSSQGIEIPEEPIAHENKAKNAQEAHEAIRPTDIHVTVTQLPEIEQSIYEIIHRQTLASQCKPATRIVTQVKIKGDNDYDYQARGVRYTDYGFLSLLPEMMADYPPQYLPKLSEGQLLHWIESAVKAEKTKPPFRYTYSSLIEEMELKGIGRPSTYATIFNTLIERHKYVVKVKRSLRPTELGEAAIQSLEQVAFVDQKYSASLENQLDDVSLGNESYQSLLRSAYETITDDLSKVTLAPKLTKPCPVCGGNLQERSGTHGKFYGCSNYPECKHTEQISKGKEKK